MEGVTYFYIVFPILFPFMAWVFAVNMFCNHTTYNRPMHKLDWEVSDKVRHCVDLKLHGKLRFPVEINTRAMLDSYNRWSAPSDSVEGAGAYVRQTKDAMLSYREMTEDA